MDKTLYAVLDPRGQPSGVFGKALSPENEMMDLLNPLGQPETTLQTMHMAKRLDALDGKTVYLVETGFAGAKEFMESHGVEVTDLNLDECKQLMREFIENNPDLWKEDIGEL